MNLRNLQFVKYVTYLKFTRNSCYMYLVYLLDAQCTVVYIYSGPPLIRPLSLEFTCCHATSKPYP